MNESQNINYGKLLSKKLKEIEALQTRPRLLLHVCCAPCSSYVLEYLNHYFEITLYFYNPNISPKSEHDFRAEELKRLLNEMPLENLPEILIEHYEPEVFLKAAEGLENEPEGGKRCEKCFYLRLQKAAEAAKAQQFDYFTTTLSISPHKNAALLNEIGKALSEQYGVPYLFSDFKKNNGYKRSCELSREYHLYRQNYCGCAFSKAAAAKKEPL